MGLTSFLSLPCGEQTRQNLAHMKTNRLYLTFILLLTCLASPPRAQAISPPPDGCYPAYTTAEGCNALQSLTTGLANTGIGWYALFADASGSYNTAVGAGALDLNTGDENTATGTGALLLHTSGDYNTANGAFALVMNSTGVFNTAIGDRALENNDGGNYNTAVGTEALLRTTGDLNNAVGVFALLSDTTGGYNTGVGNSALLSNTSGNNNTALGAGAGSNLTTGDNNIDIGYNVLGTAGESNTIRIGNSSIATTIIRGIFNETSSGGIPVLINSDDTLGTMTSSARFKHDIKPMDKASEVLYALKPVAFRYKNEIDAKGTPQFGLVAEDVEKVNADLIVRDNEGKPYSVRYDQVNAMLLNEFLKAHQRMQEQDAAIARQQKQIESLTAGLQKVSAQLELSKPAPETVLNSQ
jgi:hypothetical protein